MIFLVLINQKQPGSSEALCDPMAWRRYLLCECSCILFIFLEPVPDFYHCVLWCRLMLRLRYTSDNYCYHCGFQYHITAADVKRARKAEPSNLALYFVIILLIIGIGIIGLMGAGAPPYLDAIGALLAILLCVVAFFRRRRFFNQILAIFFALVAAIVYLAL